MAALYSSNKLEYLDGREFCAFHVSGGTTDMLKVKAHGNGFLAERVGGSADLNAGQVIDRIGVYMGLSFPAGPYLEKLALENQKKIPSKKIPLRNMSVNLSGLENMAEKLYSETDDKHLTSAFALDYIGKALIKLAESYEERYGTTEFVFAGGVLSNSIIKSMIAKRFDAAFAIPSMSADNAVGIAALTLRELK